jgi:hypothetical protein
MGWRTITSIPLNPGKCELPFAWSSKAVDSLLGWTLASVAPDTIVLKETARVKNWC